MTFLNHRYNNNRPVSAPEIQRNPLFAGQTARRIGGPQGLDAPPSSGRLLLSDDHRVERPAGIARFICDSSWISALKDHVQMASSRRLGRPHRRASYVSPPMVQHVQIAVGRAPRPGLSRISSITRSMRIENTARGRRFAAQQLDRPCSASRRRRSLRTEQSVTHSKRQVVVVQSSYSRGLIENSTPWPTAQLLQSIRNGAARLRPDSRAGAARGTRSSQSKRFCVQDAKRIRMQPARRASRVQLLVMLTSRCRIRYDSDAGPARPEP